MKKQMIKREEIKLLGICVRTHNAQELDPKQAKIGVTLARYFGDDLAASIPNRVQPGVTYCVYTDFESDEQGEYSYVVGEAVSAIDEVPEGFVPLTIAASDYAQFQ